MTCLSFAVLSALLGMFNAYIWWWQRDWLWLVDRHFRLTAVLKFALLTAKLCMFTMPNQVPVRVPDDINFLWSCRVASSCPSWCTDGELQGSCRPADEATLDHLDGRGMFQTTACFCTGRWYSFATVLSSCSTSSFLLCSVAVRLVKLVRSEGWQTAIERGEIRRPWCVLLTFVIVVLVPQILVALTTLTVIFTGRHCLDIKRVALMMTSALPIYMVGMEARWQLQSHLPHRRFAALHGPEGDAGLRMFRVVAFLLSSVVLIVMMYLGVGIEVGQPRCSQVQCTELVLLIIGMVGVLLLPSRLCRS